MKLTRVIAFLLVFTSLPGIAAAMSFGFTFSGNISESSFTQQNPGFLVGDEISGYGRLNYSHMPQLAGQSSPGSSISQYTLAGFSPNEFVSYELHFNGVSIYSKGVFGTLIIADQNPTDKLGIYNNFVETNLLREYDCYGETLLSFSDITGETFTDSSLPIALNPLYFTTGFLAVDLWGSLSGLGYLGNIAIDIDQVAFTPAPEPAVGILLLSGFAILANTVRRKKTTALNAQSL
jgi:hypothetical protein